MNFSLKKYRSRVVIALLLFLVGSGVRLLHQSESKVNLPLRADAREYVMAAYNLTTFGIYSSQNPSHPNPTQPPTRSSDRLPGYPLFLTLFFDDSGAGYPPGFQGEQLLKWQALLGGVAVILTYLIALKLTTPLWAMVAGVLVAFNPHLIALDGYYLTETLFVALMLLGVYLFLEAWLRENFWLMFFAALTIAWSAEVRLANLFLVPWLSLLFFIRPEGKLLAARRTVLRFSAASLLGFALVVSFHFIFTRTTQPPPQLKKQIASKPAESAESKIEKSSAATAPGAKKRRAVYTNPGRIPAHFRRAIRPLNFFVNGESHIALYHLHNRRYKVQHYNENFWSNPWPYLAWNLWGRYYINWHWDNAYNGDVYTYPMIRKGFEANGVLKVIHRLMKLIHWPLYLLALALPLALLYHKKRVAGFTVNRGLLIVISGFYYYIFLISLYSWFPRYFIPARPFALILATVSLALITDTLRQGLLNRVDFRSLVDKLSAKRPV